MPIHGKLVAGVNFITPEFSKLQRLQNFMELSPREMKWPVDLEFGGGVAYTVDGGTVAHATNNEPVEATATYAWLTKRFDVTFGQFVDRQNARFRRARIVEQLSYQGKQAIRAFHKRVAVAFYGQSDNVLCLVQQVTGDPTWELKDHYGITGAVPPVKMFTPNRDTVAFIDPGGPTVRGRSKITATAQGPPATITTAGTIAGAAISDQVVLANQGDGTGTDLDLGFAGIYEHANATSLFGISSVTWPDWAPGLFNSNLAAVLTGKELFTAFETSEQASDYTPDFAFTTIGVVAAAGGAQLDQRRYSADDDVMRIGFKNISVMGVTPETSPWTPAGWFLADSTRSLMKMAPSNDIQAVEESGSKFRAYDDYLGYFCDQVFRIALPRKSRASLVLYMGVTDS